MSDPYGGRGTPAYDPQYRYGRSAPHPSLDPPISKSWLFEIADRESGNIEESFTLVLPPTALSIKEPQRVSITKTFGNAFVDDYGPDNLQITIKGISGTTHAFPTFQTRGAVEFSDIAQAAVNARQNADRATSGYTGRDAFYMFRDRIMRYKDRQGWEKKELRVYDLADEQAYKCILLDFTLDRNADQPLRYPFTISLFVYQRLEKMQPILRPIKIAKDPVAALNEADSLLDKLKELYKDVKSIINTVTLLKAKALELRTRYSRFLSQATRLITAPLDLAKNFIDIGFTALGAAYDTYQAGKYTFDRYVRAEEMLLNTLNQGLKIYGYQISEGWQLSRTVTLDVDGGIDVAPVGGGPPSRRVSPAAYEFSGLEVYTVRGADTLQLIARNELGNEDLWPYIAYVNPTISTNDDLVPGSQIFLPVQVEPSEGVNKEQFILTEDATRDPYGTDIRLDSSGNIVIQENSDFSLISGIENVQQAIDLRLNTLVGSMLKQSAYGITAQAGLAGTTMAIRYLKLAIRATLVQDPRIESVDNLIVTMDRDALFISMNITVIGAEQSLPVTVQL